MNTFDSVIEAGGMILLKSDRKILAGEKIYISYGVHYKRDDKSKRHCFLQKRAVECNCVYCVTEISAEHTVDVDDSSDSRTEKLMSNFFRVSFPLR